MGSLMIWNDVWSFASMECVRSWSSGIFQRWIQRWAMGSLSVWGDVRSFAVMEYVQSCDSGIFWSWWPKVVSPYSKVLPRMNDDLMIFQPIIKEITIIFLLENDSERW